MCFQQAYNMNSTRTRTRTTAVVIQPAEKLISTTKRFTSIHRVIVCSLQETNMLCSNQQFRVWNAYNLLGGKLLTYTHRISAVCSGSNLNVYNSIAVFKSQCL